MTTETASERQLDASSVLTHLRDKSDRPISVEAIAEALGLGDDRVDEVRSILSDLVDQGEVVRTRKGAYGIPDRMNLVVGRLSAHPDGYGFIVSERRDEDLYVPGRHMGDALHDDRVVARIEHKRSSGKLEGRIIRILERARTHLVGKLERSKGGWWIEPLNQKIGSAFHVPGDQRQDAGAGKIVYGEIIEYPKGGRSAEAKVVEVLGDPEDGRVDVEIVIREYDLPHEMPEDVLREAKKVPTEVTEAETAGRSDFRELPIVTIDGESAKDFDDAVYVEIMPNGNYRLQVHIADVSHYVAEGSAIEREARLRTTSVYFPDRVIPMLPEELSNEICSLKPEVDRLTQSVLIEVDRSGKTVNYELHDGVIRSAARMTYREVAGILGGDDELIDKYEDHRHHFERMRELADLLMEYRRRRGSIDFDLPEPEVVINLRGETEDIVRAERNIAHRIIEEFMIRANEVVASHLTWEDMRALYRVHDGPDPERVESFREFISGLGHGLGGGDEPEPEHFMELLERIQGRPEERVITQLMLRCMKQARYQIDNEGHFGLASEMYTHFTSPIRRYPDLVIHRLLRAERGSDAAAEFDLDRLQKQLERTGAECSERERRAEQAEREYCDWKKVQFMADKLGEVYEGHITTVRSFGCFVELEPIFVEGLVPVSTLDDDYYRYDEPGHRLVGENKNRVFSLGDRVKVRVAKVDLERRRLDFAIEEGPLELPKPPPEKRKSRRGRGGRGKKRSQQKSEPQRSKQGDDSGGKSERDSGKGRKRGRKRGRSRGRGRGRGKGDQQQQQQQQQQARGSGSKDSGGKSRSRKGSGRGGKQQRKGRGSSDSSQVGPAPQRAEQPDKKDRSDDKKKPAVNPYLTDLDL